MMMKPHVVKLMAVAIVAALAVSLSQHVSIERTAHAQPNQNGATPGSDTAESKSASAMVTLQTAFVLADSDVVPPAVQREMFVRAASPHFAIREAQFRLVAAPENPEGGRLLIAEFFTGRFEDRGVPSLSRAELVRLAAKAINDWLANLQAVANAAARQEAHDKRAARQQKLADYRAEKKAADAAAAMLQERIDAIGENDSQSWRQTLLDAHSRALHRALDASAKIAELEALDAPAIVAKPIRPELVTEHGDGAIFAPLVAPPSPTNQPNNPPDTGD